MKKKAAILLALLGLLLVARSRFPELSPQWFGPSPTPPPPVTDCTGPFVHVSAWVDANANGTREDGERPLANVRLRVVDVFSQGGLADWEGVTDDQGAELFGGSIGPCPQQKLQFEVSALSPAGYEPTTPVRVLAWDACSFGFRRLN